MTNRLPTLAEMFESAARSAAEVKAEAEARHCWPANPFPSGPRDGSATDKLLAALEAAHPRWLEHHELMRATGRSRGALAWALRYLAQRGRVESIHSARHPRYLRYRWKCGDAIPNKHASGDQS